MNNHQNAKFHQLDNFIKHSHSFAMTIFHKITMPVPVAFVARIATLLTLVCMIASFVIMIY
jgi:hypothetical protein